MGYRWLHRVPRSFASERGSSTLEYVILIAVGILLASLLYAALSSDSVQQALKNRVIQALTGEQTAIHPTDDYPDRDNDQTNQPATPPASSSPTQGEADPGLWEGLRDFGGKLLDDTKQWFVDIYEKDMKGAWNDPVGYFLETIGWEDIKHSWQKVWDDPLQYLQDSWNNTVEGWSQFWDNPLENGAKLIFDWEQFGESWRGKDENGQQIPLLKRIWGVAESLPTPAKAIKVVSIADGIFIHDGCAKKKGTSGCGGKNNSLDHDRQKEARDIIAKAQDEDQLVNDLIELNIDESNLYQSLRERYPEEKARAIARNIKNGIAFNEKMAVKYKYNEIYIENASAKNGKVRLDSYDDDRREIVSRKYTQLAAIKPKTAMGYISELRRKYPPGARIADVPSQRKGSGHRNDGLAGEELQGEMILEVPVQKKKVPKEILDEAKRKRVRIRDENGKILNP